MYLTASDFEIFAQQNYECFQMASLAIAQSQEPYPVGILYRERDSQTIKMVVANLASRSGAIQVLIGPEDHPIDETTFTVSKDHAPDAKMLMDRTIRLILWNRDKIAEESPRVRPDSGPSVP